MDYQTFQPCSDLREFVNCYWTLKVPKDPSPEKQRIIPDGCIEMIFTLADDIRRYRSDDQFIIQPRSMIMGHITKPFYIQPIGRVDTFAVRFDPGGFRPFFTYPIKELENKETELDVIVGPDSALELENNIVQADGTSERIKIVEKFFLSRMEGNQSTDDVIKSTIDMLLATKGNVSITELSNNNLSKRRQLERRFSKLIGLRPKQLANIIRLQSTLKQLLDRPPKKLTDLAYQTNYYDQAHFIKEFKAFTGVTPKKFYEDENLVLSSVFYQE